MADSLMVTGDKELDRAMAALPAAMQRKGIRKGTRAGAKIVELRAKALAPADSGDLEASIKVRALKRQRRGTFGHGINAGATFTGGDGLPYYSAFVEFGTVSRQTKDGENRGSVQADPFLRPALWESTPAVLSTVKQTLRDWLHTIRSVTR